jgi:DNA-binding HxlR family transcriptional regulator
MMMLNAHLQKYGMKGCPINNSLRVIGKKFTLNILRNMMLLKQNRFGQFLESIEEINTKTLSIRLREMEEDGLINRVVISSRPVQTEYSLTEKAMALEPMLELLVAFSMKYEPKIIFKDGKKKNYEDVFGNKRRLSDIYDY